MRVLLVEDDAFQRELLECTFVEAGHTVVLTEDGQEAWELLDRGDEFDLVLSDRDMPRMDGLELLRRVRTGSRTAAITFVLTSGSDVVSLDDSTPLKVACAKYGASFIEKPFSLAKLDAILGRKATSGN